MRSTPTLALVAVVAVVVVCLPGTLSVSHSGDKGGVNKKLEGRAGRTRREQGKADASATVTPSGIPDTEPTTEAIPTCTGAGDDECAALTNSVCNKDKKVCKCVAPYDVFDLENSYCGKVSHLGDPCKFSSECSAGDDYSVCNDQNLCACGPGFKEDDLPELGSTCIETSNGNDGPGAVDPAMIGVLAGLILMFVIICVVLRLFSKARFRENRSIFNTPNPRLMNASLFKDSKLLSPARGDRRGSRASVRVPSRAASITSVNASRSPNGSLAKGRRGSALSTASATGSNHAHTAPSAKTPSPVRDNKKAETTVAIETVD